MKRGTASLALEDGTSTVTFAVPGVVPPVPDAVRPEHGQEALTKLRLRDGFIYEADIVVSSKLVEDEAKLRLTLTHEFGHLLGLDHPLRPNLSGNQIMKNLPDPGVVGPSKVELESLKRIYSMICKK